MSLVSKAFELRLDAIEQELSEIRQNAAVVSQALIRIHRIIEDFVAANDEQRRVDENLRDGKCPDGCCDLPEAPESTD